MKNQQLKTQAIVIKRINFKDQDKIITLYTNEFGKIGVLAKGIRKIDSKRKSHFELGNLIKVELIESHKFYIAAQTELNKSYSNIKKSFERANALYYILEVFDGLIPEKDENITLFRFLEKTLITLEVIELEQINHFLNAYTIKILRLGGFLNDPQEILHTKLTSDYSRYFSVLINVPYNDLLAISEGNQFLIGESFKLLKLYTEEILEKRIKSYNNSAG
jgi:DNA repair protein RecO